MRTLDLVLCASLTIAITTVGLPMAEAQAAPAADDGTSIEEAKALYEKGRTAFEMADYGEAITLWKDAYAKLPDGPDAEAIKNKLVFNISEAQVRAYEIDKDVTHLRKARVLLSDYIRAHEQLYGSDAAAVEERAEAQTRMEEIDEMIAAADESGTAATPTDEPPPDEKKKKKDQSPSEAEQRAQQERAARDARMQQIQTDPELRKQDAANKKKIVTGAVLGGIGITLLAGAYVTYSVANAAVTTPTPTNPTPSGTIGTGALVTTLVLGLAGLGLAGAGAGVFATGMKRRKQLRTPQPAAQSMLVPWASPRGGGATYTVRF